MNWRQFVFIIWNFQSFRFQVRFDVFLVIHAWLHWIWRNHPKNSVYAFAVFMLGSTGLRIFPRPTLQLIGRDLETRRLRKLERHEIGKQSLPVLVALRIRLLTPAREEVIGATLPLQTYGFLLSLIGLKTMVNVGQSIETMLVRRKSAFALERQQVK
jgi:hypothetical protein